MAGIMTGFAEDALSYFVSKHGVVTLTRTLNASFHESGVEVKAICPAWADTEIVSGVDGDERKAKINSLVKSSGGLMTTEFVAEAFFSLLTECPRGSVMGVLNKMPQDILGPVFRILLRVGDAYRVYFFAIGNCLRDFSVFLGILLCVHLLVFDSDLSSSPFP